ncbi:hypothetical protein WME76_12235 [Sorangium sp. So ce119]|uniref:hypothetical protein n=1 Tax=Sorangium sp. So ce119 TaxID=3133279 RepID=UPI003F5F006F
MEKTSFSLGRCTVVIDDELIILSVSRDAPLPSGVRPVLREGMRADHLTIPLKPRREGPHAGKHWIHLTYPDRRRVAVAIVDPEEFRLFGDAIAGLMADAIGREMAERVRRVDPGWLSERGYRILFSDPAEFSEQLRARFQQGKRRYRISMHRIEDLAKDLLIADPEILDDEEFRALCLDPVHAVRLDDEGETLFLQYKTEGLQGDVPGWYAYPSMTPDESLLAEVDRRSGYRLGEFVRTVCRELGLPADWALFDGMAALRQSDV